MITKIVIGPLSIRRIPPNLILVLLCLHPIPTHKKAKVKTTNYKAYLFSCRGWPQESTGWQNKEPSMLPSSKEESLNRSNISIMHLVNIKFVGLLAVLKYFGVNKKKYIKRKKTLHTFRKKHYWEIIIFYSIYLTFFINKGNIFFFLFTCLFYVRLV